MAQANFTTTEETPTVGDSVVQWGDGTQSVWRLGKVVSIDGDKAKVQFDVQSCGTSWAGHGPILIELKKIEKIAA